jgi:hypothetical protein
MTAPVNLNKTDFVANARRNWGDALPDWVVVLAEEATRTNGVAAAKRLGYSPAVVTQVINATYKGDLGAVEQKVRGALMGVEVDCPILGEIGRDRCLDEQRKKFRGTSAIRTRLYVACRGGCSHSRLKSAEAANVQTAV